MKRVLNWFLSILGFVLLIALLLISLNNNIHFIDTTKYQGFINFLTNYGPILIVGLLVLVNIIGKSVVRIILVVLFLAVAAFYIFSSIFPVQFIKLFGIA